MFDVRVYTDLGPPFPAHVTERPMVCAGSGTTVSCVLRGRVHGGTVWAVKMLTLKHACKNADTQNAQS